MKKKNRIRNFSYATKMKNAGGRFFESFFGAQSGREHRNERKMRVVKPGGGL